jgi:L-lactate dehydrogenase (cytochrome)
MSTSHGGGASMAMTSPNAAPGHITTRPEVTVARRMRDMLALEDFERAAKRHLPKSIFGYVAGAAEKRAAFFDASDAFDELALVPRVLRDMSARSQQATLFGKTYAHPFGIAPMGSSALAAYDGDVVLARAAQAAGIPSIVSAASLTKLERVVEQAPGRWFQAYLPGEADRIEPLVDRVARAGFEVLVLTVDVAAPGNREHYIRVGFDVPLRPSLDLAWQGLTHPSWLLGTALRTIVKRGMPHFENMDAVQGPPVLSRNLIRAMGKRDQFTWEHVALIRQRWKGKLVIKGLLAADDARIAREHGVDGLIVSNHGGRQLDGALAPLRALEPVLAQSGAMTVMLDGGIRRGTDVLKALALGAHFVFIGRPFLFAAAAFGAAGVNHGIRLLSDEIDRDMVMLGARQLGDLGPHMLHDRLSAARTRRRCQG